MWSVRTIPPNNLVPTQLKVAAYCRVSTNSLEQQTSLSSQEQYYEEWIKRIPHWTFAGIYSDIGSGTQAKGRRRFNAMISACRRGKIDIFLFLLPLFKFSFNTYFNTISSGSMDFA